ncbi:MULTISPECIES: SDR family NAD(P)-dependent oxidoreductase [unclassified Azospirillum]|uniref:SDR family NAD(P)-dependent oxidoreductase n=1 Tax=unclassified Azospirillum TaxID=2630922 RepID=UPI000B6A0617|nr:MULTISPECIES: SDR family NAD(P)-dependent oxidoreductase [unclassified Azospirillum]SNS38792.1 Short-chain dehydrogenase [Azospirillum sp. RU38E]SNS57202.1 Short-chain dehydrogenase [Azospirillum sp. RU37A]
MSSPTQPSPQPQRLAGRVALVTGASRGIGAAVAEQLALEGAHVVLLARTVGALEEVDDRIRAKGGAATLIPQDLMDGVKLDALGPALYERFGRLDIFVHAAAQLGSLGPIAHADPKDWDKVFGVGVAALLRLIRTTDPLLRRSDAGRALLLTDRVGREPIAYWSAYAAAKAALDMMGRTWAAETLNTTLRVNLLDPGPARTGLRAKAFPGEDPASLQDPVMVARAIVEFAVPACALHGELIDLNQN